MDYRSLPDAPESAKYHGGYDPSDPPQFGEWCSDCERWADDCVCEELSDFHRERLSKSESDSLDDVPIRSLHFFVPSAQWEKNALSDIDKINL